MQMPEGASRQKHVRLPVVQDSYLPQNIISKQESVLKRCGFPNNIQQPVIGDDDECVHILSEGLNAIVCLHAIACHGSDRCIVGKCCMDTLARMRSITPAHTPDDHVFCLQM